MTETTFEWRPTIGGTLQRNVRLAALGLVLATVVTIVLAVATPGRFVIVLAVLFAGIGVLWWLEHRRFGATVVTVDRSGILHVQDGRTERSIDLSAADTVRIEQRTQPGVSVIASTPRWTIEVSGPAASMTFALAHAGGLFNADRSEIEQLEAALAARAGRGGVAPSMAAAAPGAAEASAPPGASSGAPSMPGAAAGPGGRYEWRPPIGDRSARRRQIYRICYVLAAVGVAVAGAAAVWGDWVGVVLSAVTVPGLILAFCGGLDYAFGRPARFAIVVEHGELRVERGGQAKRRIALAGATVTVRRASVLVGTASGTTRSTTWNLDVSAPDGSKLLQVLPTFGSSATSDDFLALETDLQRLT